MLTISVLDLTISARATLPALPPDGTFTLERGQTYKDFPILGSYPQVQATAPGLSKMSMQLDLWGSAGQAFFYDFLEPAFGYKDGSYQAHLLQIAWGPLARHTFTGLPLEGLPKTKFELGRRPGEIFAVTLELTLTQVQNRSPRTIDVPTGRVVPEPTRSYVVKAGDDLGRIARLFKTTLQRLSELNNNPPFRPQPGTVLVVPR